MVRRADNRAMILFALIAALVITGLILRLRADGDHADRDRRGWMPGTGR